MAMCTLVRGKVKLKDEFIEEVDMCIKHDSFKEFAYKFKDSSVADMCERIILNSIDIASEEWNSIGDFKLNLNHKTGILTFESEIVNRNDIIDTFFNDVLSKICEEVYHLETKYEEFHFSNLYVLRNGEIKSLNRRILYIENWELKYYDYDEEDILYSKFDLKV